MTILEKRKIAILDDDPVVLEGCRRILLKEGYELEAFSCPLDLVARLPETFFHVLITDMKMPEMNGLEVIEETLKLRPQTRIVVMTAYASVDSAVSALKLGAVDYIPKPFTSDQLKTAVREALSHEVISPYSEGDEPAVCIPGIVGSSAAMEKVVTLLRRAASTKGTVYIHGESGTGKELIARALHRLSPRRENNFVVVDCTSLTEELFESALYGHRKGAFTGAIENRTGFFQEAHGGTLFLDEIGELKPELQAKFLRVIQEKTFTPVGSTKSVSVDVRLVTATNRNLKEMVLNGHFREDLYYRIFVFPIFIPSLEERREEIPDLLNHFIAKHNSRLGTDVKGFSDESLCLLSTSQWPGNVRQLENVIQRAMLLTEEPVVQSSVLKEALYGHPETDTAAALASESSIPESIEELNARKKELRAQSVLDIERRFIENALTKSDGNVSQAARMVGMDRGNFQSLMRKHSIKRD